MSTTHATLASAVADRVATVTLHRPDKPNALTHEGVGPRAAALSIEAVDRAPREAHRAVHREVNER